MMIKRKVDQFWFPWWPEKWLWGTIRIECTPAERGIWVDLLSLASKDDGHIRANEETPYPIRQLAGTLLIPEKELTAAINKFVKMGKLIKTKWGTLYVTKWEKYQFSKRHKRRIEGGVAAKPAIVAAKPALKNSTLKYNKLNYNKKELPTNLTTVQEKQIYNELCTVKGLSVKKCSLLMVYLKELSVEFPDLDYVEQMKKKVAWWLDNPLTIKSNVHLQVRNWFIIAQKGIDEAKRQHNVGAPRGKQKTKYPMSFLNNVYRLLRKHNKDGNKYAKLMFTLNDKQAKAAAEEYKDDPAGFIKHLEVEK